MLDNEIKNLWKSLDEFELVALDMETLNLEVQEHCSKMEKQIKRRNVLEIMTAIVLMPVAGFIAWIHPSYLVKLGAMLMIPYLILVIYKLLKVRVGLKPLNELSDNLEFLRQSLLYYLKEKQLLGTVPFWYVTPAAICTTLIIIGTGLSGFKLYYAFAIITGISSLIIWLNRQVVTRRINPLIEKLQNEIKNTETTL